MIRIKVSALPLVIFAVTVLYIALASCISMPIPSAEPMPFTTESLSFIKTGVTTRDEVRKHLGVPDASRKDGKVYIYMDWRQIGHTALLVGASGGMSAGVLPLYKKAYEIDLLIIQFDAKNVVHDVDLLTDSGGETKNGIKVSNPGYKVFGGMYGRNYMQFNTSEFHRNYMVLLAPPSEDEQAQRFLVPFDMCAIYYYRDLPWYKFPDQPPVTWNMIRVAVILDEVNMGDHDKNEYFYWLVKPGKHIVRSRDLDRRNIGTDSSITFECVAGQSYFIEQSWNMWHLPPNPIQGSMALVDQRIGKQAIEKRRLVLESGPSDECAAIDHLDGVGNSLGIGKQAGVYCPNADLGHADAQLHIGDILYHGASGRKADPVRAWVWYSLAAQKGDEVAEAAVTRIASELTPEQLEEAKRQLAAWQPGQCAKELVPDDSGQ